MIRVFSVFVLLAFLIAFLFVLFALLYNSSVLSELEEREREMGVYDDNN